MYVKSYGNCLSLSGSIIPSRSMYVVANDIIVVVLYGRIIFRCVYMPDILYPFIFP